MTCASQIWRAPEVVDEGAVEHRAAFHHWAYCSTGLGGKALRLQQDRSSDNREDGEGSLFHGFHNPLYLTGILYWAGETIS